MEQRGGPQSLLCLYLLSCFASDYPKFSHCPSDCQCFKAREDGFIWNKDDTISLICQTPPATTHLTDLTQYKLNTFVINSSLVYDLKDEYFKDLSISSLVLSDQKHEQPKIHSMSFNSSAQPFLGFVNNSLKSLTLLNLNLQKFNWKPFHRNSNLEMIHIENCVFEQLFDDFTFDNVVSLTIDNTHLDFISQDVFSNWKRLRMLKIANNPLKSLDWRTPNLLSNLLYLNLYNNSIEKIPENFFHSWKKLRTLNLDSNNILFLQWKDLWPFPSSLKEFSIDNNTFCANTAMMEVWNFINNTTSLMNTTDELPLFFYESIYFAKCIKPSEKITWPIFCNQFFKDPDTITEDECANYTMKN